MLIIGLDDLRHSHRQNHWYGHHQERLTAACSDVRSFYREQVAGWKDSR